MMRVAGSLAEDEWRGNVEIGSVDGRSPRRARARRSRCYDGIAGRSLLDAVKANPPKFPLEFMGGLADMKSLFHSIAQARGYPIGHGFRLWESIPPAIRDLPCFLDSLTGLWRYEYGEPIALSSGFMIGTPMFPDVETLFGVVGCASWRLSEPRFQEYTNRLIDKFKHEDTLTEFAPILRLPDNFQVTNEAAGSGPGNATIDWRIESPGEPPLML